MKPKLNLVIVVVLKIDFNSINSLLKNITIYTEHGERKRYYNFHSLLPNGPESIFFEDGCGEKLSVFEYFSQRYHLHLDVQNPLILAKSMMSLVLHFVVLCWTVHVIIFLFTLFMKH